MAAAVQEVGAVGGAGRAAEAWGAGRGEVAQPQAQLHPHLRAAARARARARVRARVRARARAWARAAAQRAAGAEQHARATVHRTPGEEDDASSESSIVIQRCRYKRKTKKELQALCGPLGLDTRGKKDALKKRLRAHDSAAAAGAAGQKRRRSDLE